MLSWLKNIQKRKKMARFAEERSFNLKGRSGLSVNGLSAREFGYLLRFITNGKHENFEDFQKIANDSREINAAIALEIAKPTLREEEANFTTHEGAIHNQENLRNIIAYSGT